MLIIKTKSGTEIRLPLDELDSIIEVSPPPARRGRCHLTRTYIAKASPDVPRVGGPSRIRSTSKRPSASVSHISPAAWRSLRQ